MSAFLNLGLLFSSRFSTIDRRRMSWWSLRLAPPRSLFTTALGTACVMMMRQFAAENLMLCAAFRKRTPSATLRVWLRSMLGFCAMALNLRHFMVSIAPVLSTPAAGF